MGTKSLAIRVENLKKSYKLYLEPIDRLKEALHPFKKKYHTDFNALNGVSFSIDRGETVGIIGRNGSGKSTLLKMITGVLTPTEGRIEVNGKISAILELGAGFNPELNGLENIYLNTSINGISKEDTDKKIDEIVAFSELGEFIYQPIKTYSSGMKARLGFAVAINAEPDILIVDEALAVGDAAFQRKCFAKMEEIRKSGATILFVSHSEANIVNLCTRAIWLSNGEKIIEGEAKLVTGLYMKNSNKKVVDRATIVKELEALKKEKSTTKTSSIKELNKPSIEEYYDTSLKAKSTIVYEENGARIENVFIKDKDDNQVNVLKNGETYRYCYDVTYSQDYENIRCGMVIKTTNGVSLSAGQYPFYKTKEGVKVEKAKRYRMEWKFRCLFGEGTYFTNCGTYDLKRQIQLHRITDAYMFKVINNSQSVNAGVTTLLESGSLIDVS